MHTAGKKRVRIRNHISIFWMKFGFIRESYFPSSFCSASPCAPVINDACFRCSIPLLVLVVTTTPVLVFKPFSNDIFTNLEYRFLDTVLNFLRIWTFTNYFNNIFIDFLHGNMCISKNSSCFM